MGKVEEKIKIEKHKISKIKIENLEVDNNIYPRKNLAESRIKSYQESLKAGAKFPAILVQKIVTEEGEKVIVLDGVHRIESYKNENREEIEAVYWREEILDKRKPEILEQLRIIATQKNLEHGILLNEGDVELQCQRIVQARSLDKLVGVEKYLAQEFKMSEGRISQMVSVLVSRRKASRDCIIVRLKMLGYSFSEIGELVGLTKDGAAKAYKNFSTEEIIRSFQQKDKSIEELSAYYNIDQILTWAIVLQNKTDKERLTLLSEKADKLASEPWPYDVWDNTSSVLSQLLFFYTTQGNLIIAPMAKSGQIIDICLLMNRQCRAYDINPPERNDIQQLDAIDAVKKLKKNVDLFFLSQPHPKDEAKESEKRSVLSLSRAGDLPYLSKLAVSCREKLNPNGRVAFLLSDYIVEDPAKSVFIHHHLRLFEKAGFAVERIVQCPLPIDQISSDVISDHIDARSLCSIARYLLIFHKSESKGV